MRVRLGGALVALCACAGVLAGAAGAKEARLPQPPLGSFTETKGLAVDQGSHDLYAIDGRSEEQRIKVSATAGNAKLRFGAGEVEVAFNASVAQMKVTLTELICPGGNCLFVNGTNPYVVDFQTTLATTDVEQIICESGTPPLSGGTGCSVETTVNGVKGTIARYHANGTPSEFSALGSNRIDGASPGADQTPQGALHFDVARLVQIAVDDSGTATDGEIYATQFGFHLVDIFSPSGEFKGQLTTYKEGLETKPLKNVCGVAVDPTGDVYVADFSTGIHKYDPVGNPVTNADSVANFTTVELPCALGAGAGPSAGSLFAGSPNGGLFKLDASTGEVKCEVTSSATTVTVDPTSGHALSATESQVREFEAKECPASQVGQIAAGSEVRGVAVDGTTGTGGTVYVSRAGLTHLDVYGPFVEVPILETKEANPIAGTTATLHGTISADNGPGASCHFEYLPKASFDAQEAAAKEAAEPKTKDQIAEAAFAGAASAPCEPAGPFTGASVNEVSGEATPLSPETEYEFRLVGENANGSVAASPLAFETLGKPIVEGGSASGVTASTALISGAVNPRGLESEAAVEYVSEEGFEESGFASATSVPAPNLPGSVTGSGDLSAATGTGDISAGSKQISGLSVESGEIEVGQSIAAAGIPAGTTIVEIEGAGLIALSQAATESGADVPYVASSNKVINLKTTAGRFGAGQSISGPGIPPGTTILTAQAGLLLLSNPLSEPHTAAALTASGPQPVAVKLSGLDPDTSYVFRIVALNSAGAAEPGKAGSFATFPLPGPPLPDERAYELITPAQKVGEPYVPEASQREGLGGSCRSCTPGWAKPRMPMQASPEGDAVAFEGDPFEGGLASGANEYRARRGEGGWQTAGLSTPAFRDSTGEEEGFKALSADLRKAVAMQTHSVLTPQAPEGFANLYLQEEGKAGLATLIEAEPPQRDENSFRVTFAGANAGSEAVPSFSHMIFAANDALSPEEPGIAPPAPAVGAGEDDLYEWSNGTLHLVNVLPGNGEAAPNAVFGSGRLLGVGGENYDFDQAISEDGSRIFWSKAPGGQVYVREGGSSTIEVPDPGRFITASPDGAKVLLDDGMLYELQTETLTDLSGGAGGFEGLVGKSDDLSRIYFVDTEALTPPEEENANHEAAEAGEPNLYLWEGGAVRFIARLLASDDEAGGGKQLGSWHAAPGNRLAQATPDGRFLAFESRAPITGYDSTIAEGEGCLGVLKIGVPECFEVFEYDAQSDTLICASCRPSGERPIGPSNLALIGGEKGSLPQPHSLPPAGGGRLFLESQDPLTQRDSNGHIQDVYEWEPNGVGSCARAKGCLALISSGTSPKDSHFLGASDTGEDAFFLTRDRLVGADKDDFLDLYDARVGGGFEEPGQAPCAGEACRGPPAPAPLRIAPEHDPPSPRRQTAAPLPPRLRAPRAPLRAQTPPPPRRGEAPGRLAMSRLRPCALGLLFALCALAAPAAAQADFGIQSFSAEFTEADETPATGAGSHPFEYTVRFTMNQDPEEDVEGTLQTLIMELPPGLVGNPLSLPRCSRAAFDFNLTSTCPGNSQVGIADVLANRSGLLIHPGLYNLTPSPGAPVTLGLVIDNNNAYLDASLRTGGDYGANVTDAAVPTREEIQTITTHVWGLPMARAHDPQRYCIPDNPQLGVIEGCSSDTLPAPFLSLPTRCGAPLETTLRVSSVQGDEDEASVITPPLEGCESVPFEPQIKARPETSAADSPTGLAVTVKIPQTSAPAQLATAHLRDSVVTLPAGLAVNPSAADGLKSCTLAQVDLPGPGPAQCPDAAKVGTVEVSSPLVDHPLAGSVYLARQSENPFGSLIALYLTVHDPLTGVVVKQAIEVEPDPLTGQLTATVTDAPQLPFEVLDFDFFGGPRAALTTPPLCGPYTTHATLTPWTAPQGKAAELADAFAIAQGAGGGACPASEAQMPAAAGFEAGTTAPLAGAYSPFVMRLTRENGSQRLAALNVTLPPGLSAKLAGVAECSEPQIAAAEARKNPGEGALEAASPSCPASSELGTATVGAGSGAPIYVTGHAYLAGPYKGAPLSLAIITPALAGPFDLGVVVVRSALFVDEATAQVTAKSDPIPQIIAGIPLDVRSVAVRLDRSQFALNPTGCEGKQITATALSPIGAATPLAAPFQATGCRRLDFTPHLRLSLTGKGQMAKTGHPALKAVLTQPAGQANIARAQVTLPATEFIDQFHISNPCRQADFAAGTCPPASVLGSARAYTPLLDKPLEGKVYFRANGGARELPDVVADLRGQVHFVLVGFVDSVGRGEVSRTRNTFAVVPDAPVSKFELSLFGGRRGLLENSANLCRAAQRANVKLSAQNGAAQNTSPLIATSCPKGKAPRRHRGHR